jgi:hypothetical protein
MSVAAVGNYENDDVLRMMAACIQTPGVGVYMNGQKTNLLGIPVLLWGAPGVGKTARIAEMADKLGYHFVTVLASIREASDFLGIPIPGGTKTFQQYDPNTGGMVNKKVNALTFSPPDWALELQANAGNDPFANPNTPDGRRALLFLDEFSTALPDVQNALLRVVQERVVGDLQLPANVAIVAAANPPWMTPSGEGALSPPTANRFVHLNWTPPTPKQWAQWFSGKTPKAGALRWPKINMREFEANFEQLRMQASTWFDVGTGGGAGLKGVKGAGAGGEGGYLFEMPKEENVTALIAQAEENPLQFHADIFAWPSPRSWELAMRARAGCLSVNPVPGGSAGQMRIADEVTCATVGSKACTAFNNFAAGLSRTLVSAADLIDGDESTRKKALASLAKKAKNSGADFITAQFDAILGYMIGGATEQNAPNALEAIRITSNAGKMHMRMTNFENVVRMATEYLQSPAGVNHRSDAAWFAGFRAFLLGVDAEGKALESLLRS